MRRSSPRYATILAATLSACIVQAAMAVAGKPSPEPPEISAEAAIVVDLDSGLELWSKNADARMYPASLTKMMTGALAIEYGEMDSVVTISKAVADVDETGLYLEEGEQIPFRDLVQAVLIWSANDASAAVGEAVAGTVEDFVQLMNERAAQWGARDTHFVNPHGLHDNDHYSTARDLAKIAIHAMRSPIFRQIVAKRSFEMARPEYVLPQKPEDKAALEPGADRIRRMVVRKFTNRNRLLERWDLCNGIKTGYTRHAGNCLAASATSEGWTAVSVVLKSRDSWSDARTLLEWAFATHRKQRVVERGQGAWTVRVVDGRAANVQLKPNKDIDLLVPAEGVRVVLRPNVDAVVAPVEQSEKVGELLVLLSGKVVGRAPLVAAQSVPLSFWGHLKRLALPRPVEGLLLCLGAGVLLLGTAAKVACARRDRLPARR
ncbi:MAG: D-alanyl-D-alanine carboxypeptidase [Armatimonadetes bacterium]|nr:D-alanyl-D-alanine carboxypeptidase [Armatimonadota bacterium]